MSVMNNKTTHFTFGSESISGTEDRAKIITEGDSIVLITEEIS